ncbi:MAG: class I SAM-dependent methyltransferase [Candidatus Hermodarchaeota archaeon]
MNEKKKNSRKQSNIDFKFMSFLFKIRDKIHSPSIKIEKAKIKTGDIVLDYGCGPGSYSIAAVDIVGPAGKVIAVDINPLAIDKVKEKVAKSGFKNIETVMTDCKTDLNAESVDAIICFDVLHALNDKDCILNEFYRLLKLNSRLSVDDHHMKEEEIISLLTNNGLFELEEKIGKLYNFKKKS